MQDNKPEFAEYYEQQMALAKQVITHVDFTPSIQYVAGADVAYNDKTQTMIGAIVVLDATTLEVVESAIHEMETTFPYVPGLFSFREVPALKAAFHKLTIRPQLIVCDGHGISHPRKMGMAAHLGVELGVPTIGCAKNKLVGEYDKGTLGAMRGDTQQLFLEDELVGIALRTQDDVKPVFVSIGHKVDLPTTIKWVLRLCPTYRLPETTRMADQLVNKVRKSKEE